ncbi:MAG: hypothetical protein MSC30_12080 [Gaiellaceae bacterium MAG52_C11]|nr:hypothetical protein [Candidatus Gaiellasilicea maunaloa]
MGLVEDWRRIERDLPDGWADARLALEIADRARLDRAAALLGPANPGRGADELRFSAIRSPGTGVGPDAVKRLLGRLEKEGIAGTLRLREAVAAPVADDESTTTLVGGWDAAVATLPSDWSDLYCELELTSSDYLQRGALLLAPINPARIAGRSMFRFRVAHRFGYGASEPMTRRCLARVDGEGITGRVAILRSLSDTHNVDTQGPVWYVEGKAV